PRPAARVQRLRGRDRARLAATPPRSTVLDGRLHLTPWDFAATMSRSMAASSVEDKSKDRRILDQAKDRSRDEQDRRLGGMLRVRPVVLPSSAPRFGLREGQRSPAEHRRARGGSPVACMHLTPEGGRLGNDSSKVELDWIV